MIVDPILDTAKAILWFVQGQFPPDGQQMRIAIPHGRFQVGRRSDINFCLADSSVSKVHAEFEANDERLLVRDLQSTNGTFVNGIRIYDEVEVDECDVIQFGAFEFVVGKMGLDDASLTKVHYVTDWMQTLAQFHRLMTERAVVPHFQSVVQFADCQTVGYEVLARSVLPGMVSPREMFGAAEQMQQADQLSRLCRQTGIEVAQRLAPNMPVFLNTHPSERTETGLLHSLEELRILAPAQPIVLELHEAAVTNPHEMQDVRRALRDLQIGLAYDDFGAGQSRLQELAEVAPDYLKFDRSLIQNIHTSPQRQQIVASLVRMSLDIGILPLAEGIENLDEAIVCEQIGFTHAQGFLYGKPAPSVCLELDFAITQMV